LPSLLVTATDTGVGKTLIAAALAKSWRASGLDVGVMKAVASGCGRGPDGSLVSRDALILRSAAQSADVPDLICPLAFEAPLAPHVAAEMEGRAVDLRSADRALDELQRRHQWLLVEGLGGALAPLTEEISVADWAARHRLGALVVARADLGTLNHTRLTLEALAARGVTVIGVVLNRLRGGPPSLAEKTNPRALGRLIRVPVWGPVEFIGGVGDNQAVESVVERLPALPFADAVRERLQPR
jgi:dethiobiotin synthetase